MLATISNQLLKSDRVRVVFENRRFQVFVIVSAVSLVFTLPAYSFYQSQKSISSQSSLLALAAQSESNSNYAQHISGAANAISVESQSSVSKPTTQRATVYVAKKKVTYEQAQAILPVIAMCESGNDPQAKNPHSTAKGLLQIIDGTWASFKCTGNVYSREDNYRCGLKIATESGLHHWNPSKACWINKANIGL